MKGVYFLCSTSPILVGTLRPSCYNISPTLFPRTKALPPRSSLPFGLLDPQSHPDLPAAWTCLAQVFQRICGARLQSLPSVCQRGNPPSRPICLSPVFSSCLGGLCGMGAGVFVPFLNLSVPFWIRQFLAPTLLCCIGSSRPRILPEPLIFGWLEAASTPACMGWTCQVWRARTRGLDLIGPAWHWACTQDFSALSDKWPSHS